MKYPLNRGGGKGDKPRPVDSKKWEEYFQKTDNDYCRFPHKHDKDCKVKEDK